MKLTALGWETACAWGRGPKRWWGGLLQSIRKISLHFVANSRENEGDSNQGVEFASKAVLLHSSTPPDNSTIDFKFSFWQMITMIRLSKLHQFKRSSLFYWWSCSRGWLPSIKSNKVLLICSPQVKSFCSVATSITMLFFKVNHRIIYC